MATQFKELACCLDTNRTVCIDSNSVYWQYVSGGTLGNVFRTTGGGVSDLCLSIVAEGIGSCVGTDTFKVGVTGLIPAGSCADLACDTESTCDLALEPLPTPTPTITPTPTPTPSVTPTTSVTPTPSPTPCPCKYQTITVAQGDLDNSIGNLTYQDNALYVSYTGCGGTPVIKIYTVAGTYTNDICIEDGFFDATKLYFYIGDIQQVGVESTKTNTDICCNEIVTPTPTPTPSVTPTSSVTPTPTTTPSVTPTISVTPTSSVTPTPTPSNTPTNTSTPTSTPSNTPTSSVTPTPSSTPGASPTPTPSITPTSTTTPTPTSSVTPTPSNTPTSTVTPTPSSTPGASPTPTSSVTPTPSNTPTSTVTPTPSSTPGASPTPSNTPTSTVTLTPSITPSVTPSVTPTTSVTPTPTLPCLDTNWITWTGGTGGYFDLIGGGTISLTSVSTGTTVTQSVFGYTRLVCPDKNPSGIVQAIQNEGFHTYTFSQPVTNPLLAVYSLGRDLGPAITASLSADTAFTVYCSGTSSPSYAISYDLINQSFSGTEGYGIVQFVGTVTDITLYYSPFEQYTQLSWGIPCIGIPPTPTPTPTQTITPSVTPSVTPTTSVTPTPTPTPLTCPSNFCVEINIDAYSGYNGTYSFYGIYNGKYSWTGGTLPGYIYYKTGDTSSWCLSNITGGTCISTGPISPFCDGECPDFDPTIVYSGVCTPAPVDPCSGITFSADFYCNVVTVESPTPTPTNFATPTPTPTATDSTCSSFGAVVSVTDATPTPTPSSTPTPTPTFARSLNTGGTVNFVIDSGDFICYDVKELSDCDTGILYYVAGNLQFTGTTIDVGTTFKAYLNNDLKCLTYQRDVNGSATAYIGTIQSTGTTCASCGITPTPTPTSSPTPTPTMTPTPTPVPTVAPTTNFVFQSCTQNKLVIQSAQPGTLVSGRIVKINNECFTYLGSYTNYIPPGGYQTVYNNFITSTPTTVYDTCLSCVTPPTYYYQVIKQTVNCQNTGSAIYVTKPSNVSTPTVGQYVRLSGSGYVGCWKVIGVTTSAATSTSILDVFNQCDCDI